MAYTNGFNQITDPEPVKLSPLFTPTKAWTCDRCKRERRSGLARWLWGTDKLLVCGTCVTLPEWTHKLTGGTGLTWPRALRGESRNVVTFSFHIEDFEGSPGKGYHVPPEDAMEVDHDYEEGERFEYAA